MPPLNQIQLPYIARLAFVLISITILVYWMHVMTSLVTLIIFSILLSMAMYPLTQWLQRRGFGRVSAITIALLFYTAIFLGFATVLGYQVNEFLQMWPQIEKKMKLVLREMQIWAYQNFKITPKTQIKEIEHYTETLSSGQGGGTVVGTAVSTTGSMLTVLSIVPVFIFFILYYKDMLKTFLYKVFRSTKKTQLNEIFSKIYEVVHSYLSGLIIVTLIVGTLNSIGLLVLGIKSAIFFGFLAALLLIIPYFGIMIGAILPMVVALVTKDNPMYAVGVAGIFFVVQMLEGNFITPYVVGSKISVNPLAALVALFLGEMLWGVAGMALALPLTAILKVIFDSVDSLKPYGFLLGEYEMKKQLDIKSKKIHAIERELVESIHERTDEVKAIFKKRTYK